MRIGYLIETSVGLADTPYPGADTAERFVQDVLNEGCALEEAGFDGVYVPGRHGRGGAVLPSPFILLASLAGITSKVRLGTFVLVLPFYDPRKVAEEAAMLDLLSGGRITLGLGRGGIYEDDILRASGVQPADRVRRFEESIGIIKELWRGAAVTSHVAGIDYDDVTIYPRPVQQPRPPIWIGAMSDSAIRRAGALGDAWCIDPFPFDLETWKRRTALYRAAAAEAGNPSSIVLMRDAFLSESREEAEAVYGSVVAAEYRQYWDWGLFKHVPGIESKADITPKNLAAHMAIGTADDCLEDLEWCATELGVDHLLLCSRRPAGPSFTATRESIRGFGTDVLPRLSQQLRAHEKEEAADGRHDA